MVGSSGEGEGSILVCESTLAYSFFMVRFLLPRPVIIVLFFLPRSSMLRARC